MPSLTGLELIGDSFALLNVFLPGESIPATDAQYARRMLNDLLSSWSQRSITIPVVTRERFDLVADQGGPDLPYTIGPGGDFDTARPSNQQSLQAANLILTSTSPEVRVPLGVYTTTAYDANQIPGMTSGQPTGIYYNPTYAGGLGSIYLWPVPNVDTNDLELFLQASIVAFDDLSTTYDLPDGYPEALKYSLADRLTGYGRSLTDDQKRIQRVSFGVISRSNAQLMDLPTDAAVFNRRRTIFNIETGQ